MLDAADEAEGAALKILGGLDEAREPELELERASELLFFPEECLDAL